MVGPRCGQCGFGLYKFGLALITNVMAGKISCWNAMFLQKAFGCPQNIFRTSKNEFLIYRGMFLPSKVQSGFCLSHSDVRNGRKSGF